MCFFILALLRYDETSVKQNEIYSSSVKITKNKIKRKHTHTLNECFARISIISICQWIIKMRYAKMNAFNIVLPHLFVYCTFEQRNSFFFLLKFFFQSWDSCVLPPRTAIWKKGFSLFILYQRLSLIELVLDVSKWKPEKEKKRQQIKLYFVRASASRVHNKHSRLPFELSEWGCCCAFFCDLVKCFASDKMKTMCTIFSRCYADI